MKQLKLLLFLIAVSLAYTSSAQMLPRHVFCSGGGNFESAAMHVSWTIGQAQTVATFYEPTIIFSAGFQQFDDQPVMIQEMIRESQILVYPNPCTGQASVIVKSPKYQDITVLVRNLVGQVIARDQLYIDSEKSNQIDQKFRQHLLKFSFNIQDLIYSFNNYSK